MQTYLWEAWITLAPWEQGIIKSQLCLGRNNAFVINNKSEFWPLDLLDTKNLWTFVRDNFEGIWNVFICKVLTCYELIQLNLDLVNIRVNNGRMQFLYDTNSSIAGLLTSLVYTHMQTVFTRSSSMYNKA